MPPRASWATTPTSGYSTASDTGSLASGAMGTLGTNVLQQDLDALNRSVQELTTAVNNLSQNVQTGGSQFGGGQSTRQQGPSNNNSGFPRVINPSRLNQQTAGGNGGYGSNVSGMTSGGYSSNRSMYSGNGGVGSAAIAIGGAISGFGASQAMNLVPLNSYATQSLTGYNYNGMSQNQAMQQLYGQVGATPGRQLSIGSGSLQDNIQFAQTLQSAAGSQNISQTARGRGALSAAYGFGISNPNLTAASAAQMGAGLYSPMLSYNMQRLGYGQTILSRSPGGVNLNSGQSAQAILGGLGLKNATSQQVTAAFASGGKAATSLPYLLQGTNISAPAMQQYLTDYAQLMNNSKLSATQASNLMQQAASGTSAQMKAARQQLSNYGISTANNDLASLVQNQSSVTGRSGDYASGFNSGLQKSATLLTNFNNALNILLKGPLGSALGFGGGAAGTIAGSALGSGTNMLGTAGSYMLMQRIAGQRAAAAAAQGAGGEAAGAAAGGGGLLSSLGIAGAGAAITMGQSAIAKSMADALNPKGSKLAGFNDFMQKAYFGNPLIQGLSGLITGTVNKATSGGGAAAVSMSTQQQKTGGNTQSSSVSSAAKKAVSAAESQKGVPYAYGQESPGVGFDCSALIQWAYKQAGVNLPRTSQSQWAALAKRSVPMDKVQEGDLVFMAGSDGTSASPGHVGMMINSHQLIQAPSSGHDIQVISYDSSAWQHAARPSGSGSFIAGNTGQAGTPAKGSTGSSTGTGNRGTSSGVAGSNGAYGSVNEVDVISAMGSYLGSNGSSSAIGGIANGTSGSKNTVSNATKSTTGKANQPTMTGSPAAMAKKIAASYGWTGNQFQAFLDIVGAEDASWSLTAKNPTSTAYGIAQFINGPSDYYKWGGNPNNAQGQITAMMNYIKSRYKNPENAWNYHKKNGFYGAGGTTLPGLAIVGERGPEIMMQGGGNQVFSNAQTMQLINAIRGSSPAQSPWKTDTTSDHGYRSTASKISPNINISFGANSIVINSQGNSTQQATQSAQEVQRQLVKSLGSASIHQAIRNGDKL